MKFKTIGLLGRSREPRVGVMLAELGGWLRELGHEVTPAADAGTLSVREDPQRIEAEFARRPPDLVIVAGGDGTLLAAAHLLAALNIPLLGVNLGRLGFLADIALDRMRDDVGEVLDGKFTEERRFLLEGAVHCEDRVAHQEIALNDVVVQKSASGRMIEFETWVDGSFVCTHRADGVIVATPTGSTAYALSGGGPILHPALDAIVIVPICPHTLSDRPIVVQGKSAIEIVLKHGYGEPVGQVSWDGQRWQPLQPGDRIAVSRAARSICLLHPLSHDYYKTLRTKLHWGHGRDQSFQR